MTRRQMARQVALSKSRTNVAQVFRKALGIKAAVRDTRYNSMRSCFANRSTPMDAGDM